MATSPIGITFMPSDENAQRGPQEGALNAPGGSDLSQAFKILSLHLPRVLGAASLAPPSLLNSAGSNNVALKPYDPSAAVFAALLKAMTGAAGPMGGPFGPAPSPSPMPGPMPTDPGGGGRPIPEPRQPTNPFFPTAPTQPTMPTKPTDGGIPAPRITPARDPMPWEYTPTPPPEGPTGPSGVDPLGDARDRRGRGGFY